MQEFIQAIHQVDVASFLWVNARTDAGVLGALMYILTTAGLGGPLIVLSAIFLYCHDRRAIVRRIVVAILVVSTAGAFGQLLKRTIQRPRPVGELRQVLESDAKTSESFLVFGERSLIPFREGKAPTGFEGKKLQVLGGVHTKRSMPSGHSIAAFGAAACMIYFLRRRVLLVLLFASLVAFSRIYVGVHFLSDIVAGGAIGLAWSFGLLFLVDRALVLQLYLPPGKQASRAGGPRILIVAGEASADMYGANLARAIFAKEPGALIAGVGGTKMREAGVEVLHDSHELSIMGFTAVVSSLGRIRKIFQSLTDQLIRCRPDVLVCIDLPDFNLMLAGRARELGVPVCYYISPQIWAWRSGRVKKIARRVDHMVVAFPFEKKFYEDAGVSVHYEGHPLLEVSRPSLGHEQMLKELGFGKDDPIVAILPGSRRSEVEHMLDPLLDAAKIILEKIPECRFVLAVAPTVDACELEERVRQAGLPAKLASGNIQDLFQVCRFGLITSGTASLEAAIAQLPMVICYRGNALNVAVARRLVKVEFIGLPNLIAGREVAKELIQEDASPEKIAGEALRGLLDQDTYARMKSDLADVRGRLTGGETSAQVARIVLELTDREKHEAA